MSFKFLDYGIDIFFKTIKKYICLRSTVEMIIDGNFKNRFEFHIYGIDILVKNDKKYLLILSDTGQCSCNTQLIQNSNLMIKF